MASPDFKTATLIDMFGRMARTYGWVNMLSSFGFSHVWRNRCARVLDVQEGHCCADLMAGMGEMAVLLAREGRAREIEAVDFCPQMCAGATRHVEALPKGLMRVTEADVIGLERPEAFDRIAVGFGIKTLDDDAQRRFAFAIRDMLKPGGRVAGVEIHVPGSVWARLVFLPYVRWVIPTIGRLMLGDPDCYRSLAVYTEDFAKRDRFTEYFREAGLAADERPLFFGCARLYVATKSGGLDTQEGVGSVAGHV